MYTASAYIRATSLEEAYELNQKQNNKIMGGNCWLRLGNRHIGTIISLSALGLDKITEEEDCYKIGSMVTLRQLETNACLNTAYSGIFKKAVESIVGVQFRNCATVGGSVWGRFGFSDVLTAMAALDAKVELYKGGIVALDDFIATDYDNDILTAVIIPKGQVKAAYESVRLTKTDFPVLTCAVAVWGDTMRVAVGARPNKARCITCSVNEATEIIVNSFDYADNMRATKAYRQHIAKVLVDRCRRAVE